MAATTLPRNSLFEDKTHKWLLVRKVPPVICPKCNNPIRRGEAVSKDGKQHAFPCGESEMDLIIRRRPVPLPLELLKRIKSL